jgi:hypothetical protein
MRVGKEAAAWARHARSLGWDVKGTRQGHLCFKSPDKKIVHIPGKSASQRSLANSKAELRRAGLTFPEDEARRSELRRRGIDGLVDISMSDLKPAIMRTSAKIPDAIIDENIRGYSAANPDRTLTVDDILIQIDAQDSWSGEEDEIEIEPVRAEEEQVNMGSPAVASNRSSSESDRSMLIKFGRVCEQLNGIGEDHMKVVIDLLEQAALLELSVEEILKAVR